MKKWYADILVVGLGLVLSGCGWGADESIIMTVRGPIMPDAFGKALAHEHVMVDFVGADKTGPDRYDANEVIETMAPFLREVRERGFTGYVDCTPAYLGRDVEVLLRLSELTGLHVLTNTGFYGASGDKYVPAFAYEETAEQLARRWVNEFVEGIEGAGIRPGFIKTAVDRGSLSEIDRKLVKAAAMTHLQTGLTIACHTGEAQAAREVLEMVRRQGVDPSGLIIVHADAIGAEEVHLELAAAGAWVEYDAVRPESIERHTRLIKELISAGFGNRLLISHDAGYYNVGQKSGAKEKIRSYTAIADQLIAALRAVGVTDEMIDKLLIDNPAQAYAIRVRKL